VLVVHTFQDRRVILHELGDELGHVQLALLELLLHLARHGEVQFRLFVLQLIVALGVARRPAPRRRLQRRRERLAVVRRIFDAALAVFGARVGVGFAFVALPSDSVASDSVASVALPSDSDSPSRHLIWASLAVATALVLRRRRFAAVGFPLSTGGTTRSFERNDARDCTTGRGACDRNCCRVTTPSCCAASNAPPCSCSTHASPAARCAAARSSVAGIEAEAPIAARRAAQRGFSEGLGAAYTPYTRSARSRGFSEGLGAAYTPYTALTGTLAASKGCTYNCVE
jgi:uncharacterized protein (DUF2384 family)